MTVTSRTSFEGRIALKNIKYHANNSLVGKIRDKTPSDLKAKMLISIFVEPY